MPVEFLGIAATNDGSETHPRSGGAFDADYTLRLAAAHAEHGWDRVLTAYSSGSPDPAQGRAGPEVIPLVREEVAKREAEGRPRGLDALAA